MNLVSVRCCSGVDVDHFFLLWVALRPQAEKSQILHDYAEFHDSSQRPSLSQHDA
jgi:hypothetical protein